MYEFHLDPIWPGGNGHIAVFLSDADYPYYAPSNPPAPTFHRPAIRHKHAVSVFSCLMHFPHPCSSLRSFPFLFSSVPGFIIKKWLSPVTMRPHFAQANNTLGASNLWRAWEAKHRVTTALICANFRVTSRNYPHFSAPAPLGCISVPRLP